MDLIRLLLLKIENDEDVENTLDKYSLEQRTYHAQLLLDAELVEGVVYYKPPAFRYDLKRLTWEGHEFIDTIRDKGVWTNVKKTAVSAGAWTLPIIKELAVFEIKKRLGMIPK